MNMSKLDEKVEEYYNNMTNDLGLKVDKDLLRAVTKNLGPNIYKADASKVSASDPEELDRVKKNYLIKKLGLEDGPKLDEAIAKVMDTFGSSNRNKHRAGVYYLLCTHFGKEDVYSK